MHVFQEDVVCVVCAVGIMVLFAMWNCEVSGISCFVCGIDSGRKGGPAGACKLPHNATGMNTTSKCDERGCYKFESKDYAIKGCVEDFEQETPWYKDDQKNITNKCEEVAAVRFNDNDEKQNGTHCTCATDQCNGSWHTTMVMMKSYFGTLQVLPLIVVKILFN